MTRQLNLFFVFFLFALTVCGQHQTYLGVEAAVTYDQYALADNGDALKSPRLVGGQWGVSVRQELNHFAFLETGLLRKYYFDAVAFRNVDVYGINNAFNAWLIPIRLGAKINLYKEKLFIVPQVGYSFGINSTYGNDATGRGETRTNTSTTTFTYRGMNNLAKNFSLIQSGIGLECSIFHSIIVSLSTNYYAGLKKVYQLDINYTVDQNPPVDAKAISKGDFFNICAGLKYPVSTLWQKK